MICVCDREREKRREGGGWEGRRRRYEWIRVTEYFRVGLHELVSPIDLLANHSISIPLRTVYLMSLLSSWLLGQAVPVGSHVRLNLQTGTREVKLQDEDKFRNTLKGLKKGKRYSVIPRDWETNSTDFVILKVMIMHCFLCKFI